MVFRAVTSKATQNTSLLPNGIETPHLHKLINKSDTPTYTQNWDSNLCFEELGKMQNFWFEQQNGCFKWKIKSSYAKWEISQ